MTSSARAPELLAGGRETREGALAPGFSFGGHVYPARNVLDMDVGSDSAGRAAPKGSESEPGTRDPVMRPPRPLPVDKVSPTGDAEGNLQLSFWDSPNDVTTA